MKQDEAGAEGNARDEEIHQLAGASFHWLGSNHAIDLRAEENKQGGYRYQHQYHAQPVDGLGHQAIFWKITNRGSL
jgi:hypothetical protein